MMSCEITTELRGAAQGKQLLCRDYLGIGLWRIVLITNQFIFVFVFTIVTNVVLYTNIYIVTISVISVFYFLVSCCCLNLSTYMFYSLPPSSLPHPTEGGKWVHGCVVLSHCFVKQQHSATGGSLVLTYIWKTNRYLGTKLIIIFCSGLFRN